MYKRKETNVIDLDNNRNEVEAIQFIQVGVYRTGRRYSTLHCTSYNTIMKCMLKHCMLDPCAIFSFRAGVLKCLVPYQVWRIPRAL